METNTMEIREITEADLVARKRQSNWLEHFPTLYSLPLGKVIKCTDASEYDSLYRFIKKSYPVANIIGRRQPEKQVFEIVIRRELKTS